MNVGDENKSEKNGSHQSIRLFLKQKLKNKCRYTLQICIKFITGH